MAGQYELIFFGMFTVVVYRYILPPIVAYVRSYAELKKQEYLNLLNKEQMANNRLEEVNKTYTAKLAELESIEDKLDNTFEETLSRFREKNEILLEMYNNSEKQKIKNEISEQEAKLVDSCMEMLEVQIYQEMKQQNITCFGIALQKIREIVKENENKH